MAQTKIDDAAPEKVPTPFAPTWTRDPWVVVSKRARQVYFPTNVLLREHTEEERVALRAAPVAATAQRPMSLLSIHAGVNFLGAYTTAWALRASTGMQDPATRLPPADAACHVFWPYSNATQVVKTSPEFKARDSAGNIDHRQMDADRIAAGWLRVMKYLEAQERQDLQEAGGFLSGALFVAQMGFDAPEVFVTRLSPVLAMNTVAGQQAAAYLRKASEHAKEGLHLGALHDYAARVAMGQSVAADCRTRLIARPNLAA